MEQHPIQSLMGTSMESIREMVDVNTVVGDPVQTQDGSTVIPISKVSFGFVAGGGEYSGGMAAPGPDGLPFAGGTKNPGPQPISSSLPALIKAALTLSQFFLSPYCSSALCKSLSSSERAT